MTQMRKSVNFRNVRVKVCVLTIDRIPQEGTMVAVRGKSAIDAFLHYNEDGTFINASVWNGKTWIEVKNEE